MNNENRIKVQRCRRLQRDIYVDDGGEPLILAQGETIIFAIKDGSADDCLLTKILTASDRNQETGAYALDISSSEMDIPEGVYFYDVSFCDTDDNLHTIIPDTEIEITRAAYTGG